jgi:hypothetical protein
MLCLPRKLLLKKLQLITNTILPFKNEKPLNSFWNSYSGVFLGSESWSRDLGIFSLNSLFGDNAPDSNCFALRAFSHRACRSQRGRWPGSYLLELICAGRLQARICFGLPRAVDCRCSSMCTSNKSALHNLSWQLNCLLYWIFAGSYVPSRLVRGVVSGIT